MTPFMFALLVAVIATGLMLLTKSKDNLENNTSYGAKAFVAVFLTSFVVHTYVNGSNSGSGLEIDVGEPPF